MHDMPSTLLRARSITASIFSSSNIVYIPVYNVIQFSRLAFISIIVCCRRDREYKIGLLFGENQIEYRAHVRSL